MEEKFTQRLILAIRENILNPKEFWKKQKETSENFSHQITGFFIPFIAAIGFAVFLGEFFTSSHFYMGYAVMKALRKLVLFILHFSISIYLTNELIKTFNGQKDIVTVRKLVLFSMTPLLLVSIVTGLFQFLYVLDILGVYSFYIFWLGANELLELPKEKKESYIIITIIVNFFVFSFLSILLSNLLKAYF